MIYYIYYRVMIYYSISLIYQRVVYHAVDGGKEEFTGADLLVCVNVHQPSERHQIASFR